MIMDMQIGLFCGVFSIIASLVVYAILSFYSIKEDSFDEAKANRRKLFKEYLDQRTNAEKSKQKKTKKVTKKGKDKKSEQITEAEEKKETPTPSEVPKEVPPQPAKETIDAPKKPEAAVKAGPKIKSHPPEKEDVTATAPAPAAVNENLSKKVPEKKMKPKQQVPEKKPEVKLEVEPVQNPIAPLPKEQEKKVKVEAKPEKKKTDNPVTTTLPKKQPSGSDKQVINVKSVLSLIQKAELSRSEVQLLIDTLLNSEDETDWLKVKKLDSSRQDNCVKLRKQLSELELSLKNEKQITQSLQGKLKELRTEMAADKTSVSSLKESLTKIQQDKDELLYEKSDLNYKLKTLNDEKIELQEQLNKELAKAQQQQKLEEDHQQEAVMALKEELSGCTSRMEALELENSSLKSTVSCLEGELTMHQNCSEKLNGLERALNVLSEKMNEKDVEITSSRKQIDSLSTTLNKFKKENNDLKMANEHLTEKVTVSSKDIERLNEEITVLTDKLSSQENELHARENGDDANGFDAINYQQILEEKENHLQQMTKQIDSNIKSINDMKQELLHANEENAKLKSMLDRANNELADLKENVSKLNAQKSENDHLIESLRNHVNTSTGEITFLKEEIEKYKLKAQNEVATNGIISNESLMIKLEENDTILDQMSKQIDSNIEVINSLKQELKTSYEENDNLKQMLKKANSELAELKESIVQMQKSISEAEEINASLSGSIKGSNQEIKSLKEEIEKYKERNNELRNKNWKVVQALTDAEKALQTKLKSEEQHASGNNHRSIEELKSNVNTFVRRLFPDIDIQEYKGHFNDWLRSVEDTVTSKKNKSSPQDLQSQNAHLQSLVVNYKKIISDTEHMLNELQNHVEVEESKWREKCSSYEKEIESLRGLHRNS